MTRVDDHFEVANATQDRRYSAQTLIDVLDGNTPAGSIGYAELDTTDAALVAFLGLRKWVDISKAPYNCTFGDGVSSPVQQANTAAVQQAIDDLGASGGGTIYTPALGTLLLAASGETSMGLTYCTGIAYDNIQFYGSGLGATWKTTDDALLLYYNGAAKLHGMSHLELADQCKAQLPYPFTSPSAGALSVTMSGGQSDVTTLGLAAGDRIYLRTGQLVNNSFHEPAAEINYVTSLPGSGVVKLRYPLHIAFAQEYYDPADVTTTTLSAGASAGATTLSLTSTAGLSGNGWLNVAGTNVYYTSVVSSTVTGVKGVPGGGFSGGDAVYQGLGFTTTTPTSYLAPYGLSKANDQFLTGAAVRYMNFYAPNNTITSASTMTLHYTEDHVIEHNTSIGSWGLMNGTTNPGGKTRYNQARITSGGYKHPYGYDTGSTRCEVTDNVAVSNGVCFIHCHEANEVRIARNRMTSTNETPTDPNSGGRNVDGGSNAISIRGRAQAWVFDNQLDHPASAGAAILVFADCTNGGRIGTNLFHGAHATSILFQTGATDWVLDDQSTTKTITVPATGVRRVGVITSVGTAAVVRRTTDATPLTSQTTPQPDTTLLFPIGTGETWWFKALLIFTAVNTTMDTRIDWTVPASATMTWGAQGTASNNLGGWGGAVLTQSPIAVLDQSNVLNFGSFNGTYGIGVEGTVTAAGTGGNVTLEWSQQTSDVGALILKAGSFIRTEQIA